MHAGRRRHGRPEAGVRHHDRRPHRLGVLRRDRRRHQDADRRGSDHDLAFEHPAGTDRRGSRPASTPATRRTAHSDAFQGKAVAEWAFNEKGVKTAATIHDGSAYAEALQQVFADEFTALGGEIVAQEAVSKGQTDMSPALTAIAAAKPELLYFPVFVAEGGFIAAQALETPGSRGRHPHRLGRHVHAGLRHGRRCRRRGDVPLQPELLGLPGGVRRLPRRSTRPSTARSRSARSTLTRTTRRTSCSTRSRRSRSRTPTARCPSRRRPSATRSSRPRTSRA